MIGGYVARRILALIPTLFFASLIVFFTISLIPGSVIDLMLSQNDVSAPDCRALNSKRRLVSISRYTSNTSAGSARFCFTVTWEIAVDRNACDGRDPPSPAGDV